MLLSQHSLLTANRTTIKRVASRSIGRGALVVQAKVKMATGGGSSAGSAGRAAGSAQFKRRSESSEKEEGEEDVEEEEEEEGGEVASDEQQQANVPSTTNMVIEQPDLKPMAYDAIPSSAFGILEVSLVASLMVAGLVIAVRGRVFRKHELHGQITIFSNVANNTKEFVPGCSMVGVGVVQMDG